MSVDYYKLLQVQRNSRDVRKAVEAKLNLINDAYEVMESVNPEVMFSTFLVGGTIGENGFQWFECTDSGPGNGPRKAAAIERTSLPCTLEELYNGATKKLKIYRDVLLNTIKC